MITRRLFAALTLAASFASPALAETFTHARGEITLDGVPKTIVVYDLNALDTLSALGVAVAGGPASGIPAFITERFAEAPAPAGTLFEPDLEAVFALQPDLIITGGRSGPKYDELAKLAPTIDLTLGRGDFLASAKANVTLLGAIFDKKAEAAALIQTIDDETAALRAAAPRAGRVLVMLTTGNRMSAHGEGSRFGIIHDDYGLTAARTGMDTGNHGQAISHEFILETNPDWLFVVDRDSAVGNTGASGQKLMDNELVQKTKAGQAGHVLHLDPAVWYLVGGGGTAMAAGARAIREAITAP